MSKKLQTNQKHMNQDDHVVIEKGLDNSEPMSTIVEKFGKDPTIIAKEIKSMEYSKNTISSMNLHTAVH